MSAAIRQNSSPPACADALDLVADWFRILAEPRRLRILQVLRSGPMTAAELASATGISQGNLSRHLQGLADAEIVGRRRDGARMHCFIADNRILELCDSVSASLMKRLAVQARLLGGMTTPNPVKP